MATSEYYAKYFHGSGEDYKKYFCALGFRSVRRVAAKVYAAADLDAELRIAMLKELEIDWAVYADGRAVFTVIDWMDGYATLVHHPDSLQHETEDTGELAEEMCPSCGGMPSTEPGADDDGDVGAPSRN